MATTGPFPHSVSQSPLNKISDFDLSHQNIILLGCGSFSPVTFMHLRMFEQARDYLHNEANEERNRLKKRPFRVVGGFCSPVSDGYQKPTLIRAQHRVSMLRLAVQTSDWINVSTWESDQAEWTRTRVTLDSFTAAFARQFPTNPPRFMLVCGSDLIDSMLVPGLWSHEDIEAILKNHGIVALEREGFDVNKALDQLPVLKKFAPGSLFTVPQHIHNTISSTSIRSAVKNNRSIKYLLPDSVRDYILANKLFK